jgi:hypothetical protein
MHSTNQGRPSGGVQRQGLLVFFISFIPQTLEAAVVAGIAKACFGMPTEVCFALGYILACISPSIVVPGLIQLNDRGFGTKKNICGTLIAAGTFDDIICIICFSICKTVSLYYGGFSGGGSLAWVITYLFVQNIISFFIGVSLGLMGWVFKYIHNKDVRLFVKLIWVISVAIGLTAMEWGAQSNEAKYIAALFFGYTSYRLWG